MAVIYKKTHPLQRKHTVYKTLGIIFFSIGIFCWVLWGINIMAIHTFDPHFLMPVFFGFALFGGVGSFFLNKARTISTGLNGKKQTLSFVSSLPNDYTVVTNPKITYQGQESMLDTVVIGSNGVFIIQTKNHNGSISGSVSDNKLSQYKIGRRGTPYTNMFYNPAKQVSTHVFRLSKLLQEFGYNVWIQGIVYFSNPSAEVNVRYGGGQIPVFAASENGEFEMCEYITSYTQKKTLSKTDIEKIADILI